MLPCAIVFSSLLSSWERRILSPLIPEKKYKYIYIWKGKIYINLVHLLQYKVLLHKAPLISRKGTWESILEKHIFFLGWFVMYRLQFCFGLSKSILSLVHTKLIYISFFFKMEFLSYLWWPFNTSSEK